MGEHVDRLFYCRCQCGCTTIIASELHPRCTFCGLVHKEKYPTDGKQKEVVLK